MGNWSWEGLDKNGKRAKGKIEAASEKEARKLLRGQGVRPRKISAPSILEFDISAWMVDKGLASSFGAKELSTFTKQLAIMINAGVPIMQALEILYKSEKHPVLKKTIQQIAKDVGEGHTIAEALEKHKGFGRLYCNLVKAGETGGILDIILEKLNVHMDKQQKTRQQIKSAMTYPAIVTIVGMGVIWGMMVFIVPQFVGMLEDTGQELPWITALVIQISDIIGEYSLLAVPVILIALVLFSAYIKTKTGKYLYDRVTMKIPIFGQIIIKGNLSTFSRTLATMLSAGVSLIDSLDICIDTIDSTVVSRDLKEVKQKVIEGKTLTEPLAKIDYFPDMVSQMIKVGEQTGRIDQMLDKTAEVFEDEVNNLVDNMTKLIEPIIIVVLGGIVASILVAMYLPMFMSAGGA